MAKSKKGAADLKDRSSTLAIVPGLWEENTNDSKIPALRDRYAAPPFSVFDTKTGEWREQQKKWRNYLKVGDVGIQASEIIRKESKSNLRAGRGIGGTAIAEEAVFDPFLLEVLSDLYCPHGGSILDFFGGSHVSGCVFNTLGYDFTGVDIREKIVQQNLSKCAEVLTPNGVKMPRYICGDSNVVLDTELAFEEFDMINSCPPYVDLVKYSKGDPIKGDISLLSYDKFMSAFESISRKGVALLKPGGYLCYTLGQVRAKDTGELLPFIEDTVSFLRKLGLVYLNRAIIANNPGTAAIRVGVTFEKGAGKLVCIHQEVLIFKKK